MKKEMIIVLFLVILSGVCFAEEVLPVALLDIEGLSFETPFLSEKISEFFCSINDPINCGQYIFKGIIDKETMAQMNIMVPEASIFFNFSNVFLNKKGNLNEIIYPIGLSENLSILHGQIQFYEQIDASWFVNKSFSGRKIISSKGIGLFYDGLPEETRSFYFLEEGSFLKTPEEIVSKVAVNNNNFGFISLDPNKGNIVAANFITSGDYVYYIGNRVLPLPANTTVVINDKLIKIYLKKNQLDISKIKFRSISLESYDVQIIPSEGAFLSYGKHKIKASDLKFIGDRVFSNYEEKWMLLEINQLDFDYESEKGNLVELIFDDKEPISPNYLKFQENPLGENQLEIGLSKKSNLKINPSHGNDFFQIGKWDRSKNPPVLIPDEDVEFDMFLEGQSNLEIISRRKEGKIPIIKTSNPTQNMKIESGNFKAELINGEISTDYNGVFRRTGSAYQLQSVKGNLKSTSSGWYSITSPGSKIEIAGTDRGLRISDSEATNLIKTVDDLKAKYPLLNFEREGDEDLNSIQVINQWLEDYPGETTTLAGNKIIIKDSFFGPSSVSANNELILSSGMMGINNYSPESDGPLGVINHEFQHQIERQISEKETNLDSLLGIKFGEFTNGLADELEEKIIRNSEFIEIENELISKGILQRAGANLGSEDILPVNLNSLENLKDAKSRVYLVNQELELRGMFNSEFKELERKFKSIVKQETGLRPYAFKRYNNDDASEILTTFIEMPLELKKQIPRETAIRLAQLRLDAVHSMNNPSGKLIMESEILCAELKGKDCQPCTLYKTTCKVNIPLKP